jgi:hypothetical protein
LIADLILATVITPTIQAIVLKGDNNAFGLAFCQGPMLKEPYYKVIFSFFYREHLTISLNDSFYCVPIALIIERSRLIFP